MSSEQPPRSKNKIAVVYHIDTFVHDIIEGLNAKGYEVRGYEIKTVKDLETALNWCDTVWFEMCSTLFVRVINQNLGRLGKRVIVRWHRYEIVERNFPLEVKLENVDDLILVSHDMHKVLKARVPDINDKTRVHVIWNGVNTEKFSASDTLDMHQIAFVCKPILRKNYPMTLQILAKLHEKDDAFHLHFAGGMDPLVTQRYLQFKAEKLGLKDHVHFHGWIDDIPGFLSDKGIILSCSVHESFGYNIAEGMARGAHPVVLDYPGADEFWPEDIRFSTVEEAVEKIITAKPNLYMDYVQKFSLEKQLVQLEEII